MRKSTQTYDFSVVLFCFGPDNRRVTAVQFKKVNSFYFSSWTCRKRTINTKIGESY